ncbi:MAG: pentapeptide repeat-containing protein [Candidatus Obscuribacterales bacterium]|nr:pentapeptide repeat-containing protein [Candidatus Obscuribacterales bacterium]
METQMERLQNLVNTLTRFKTSVLIENKGILREIELTCDQQAEFIHIYIYNCPGACFYDHFRALTVRDAFHIILSTIPGGKVYLSTLIVRLKGKLELPNSELYRATKALWAAAFANASEDCKTYDPESIRNKLVATYKREFKEKMLAKLISGTTGVAEWNSAATELRSEFYTVYWTESELAGLDLRGAKMESMKLYGSNFTGADLRKASFDCSLLANANFQYARLEGALLDRVSADSADFSNASLVRASLKFADLRNCSFNRTDLAGAILNYSRLNGVDLSTAVLTGTRFDCARYDESTNLPVNFCQWSKMRWEGKSKDPYYIHVEQEISNAKVSDFDEFIESLRLHVNQNQLESALKTLKTEVLQLFFERRATSMVCVLNNSRHSRVAHVCTLSKEGTYSCCTQDLNACRGLKGYICKHLLGLSIALTKTGELGLTDTLRWILACKLQKPKLEREFCAEVLLKYKGSAASEENWTRVETRPDEYISY